MRATQPERKHYPLQANEGAALPTFDHLTPEQLRALAVQLMKRVEQLDQQVHYHKTRNEQLAHEIAILRRHKFVRRSEQLSPDQISLLNELLDTDIAAIEAELKALNPPPAPAEPRQPPKRTALPSQFPRPLIHREPDSTQYSCGCQLKRIGEDVSEKLNYPGRLHGGAAYPRQMGLCVVRSADPGACAIPGDRQGHPGRRSAGPGHGRQIRDRLPLYRQERIFGRAGLAIPRSTLEQWVGSCGVQLQPLVDALRERLLQ